MGCKRGWNREFIDLHLTKTFRNGPLRKHRAKTLMDREKAMLPAMQIFVEATKKLRTHGEELTSVMASMRKFDLRRVEILRARDALRTKIRAATTPAEERAALDELEKNCMVYGQNEGRLMRVRFDQETVNRNIMRWQNILEGRAADDVRTTEVREFIQRCPAEGCRGYLSTAYKCGTCAKYTCNECMAVKGENRDAEHTCNEEAKASAALIRRETKPCPKCGVRIYKIDGCDQMFCTQETCHTAFSWNTGHIVTGNIHNPHYYEYLRHRNGGEMPREAGDIPCGGLPAVWQFSREILAIPATLLAVEQKNLILSVHRCLTDMADVRLPDYPGRLPANVNKDINIRYLMNEMEEAEWQKQLEQRETKFERKREIGQILTTFAHVGAELFRNLINHPGVVGEPRTKLIAHTWNILIGRQVEDLRLYTNKSLVELGKRMGCAIPQVDRRWNYVPPRKEGLLVAVPVPETAGAPAPVVAGPPVINNVQAAALAGQADAHLYHARQAERRAAAHAAQVQAVQAQAVPIPVGQTAFNIPVGQRQQIIAAALARPTVVHTGITVVHTGIPLTTEEALRGARPQMNRFEAGDYAADDAVVVE
jgi:hypothetical protein